MLKRILLRFVQLFVIVNMALVLMGCGAAYEIIPTASYLPSSEQVERDRQLLAIPPDLQARLNSVMAQLGANRQFIGQMPSPEMLLHQELLKAVLGWANEKTPDERLKEQAEVMQRQSEGAVLEDWRVQRAAGTVAGAAIGVVPLGPYAADVAIELKVLPKGTYHAQVGRACGEIISGVIQMVAGCGGAAGGMTASGTGGGAVVGIPLVVASVAVAANGYATAMHGVDEAQRLWNEGPPADDVPMSVSEEPLLKPKAQPEQPAPTAQTPPAPPAAPAQTRTTTRNKTTGVTESHSASGTTTTSRPKKAPATQPTGQTSGPGKPAPTAKPAPSEGWRVGDDIYKPTAKGEAPNWSTVRARYWKNEAAKSDAAKVHGAENVERMKRGLAPQRYNEQKGGWESKDLSHEPTPARNGGTNVVDRWPQDHAKVDSHRRPGY